MQGGANCKFVKAPRIPMRKGETNYIAGHRSFCYFRVPESSWVEIIKQMRDRPSWGLFTRMGRLRLLGEETFPNIGPAQLSSRRKVCLRDARE